MSLKVILAGALAGSMLFLTGCQSSLTPSDTTLPPEEEKNPVVEAIDSSEFKYPASNEDFYYHVYDKFIYITKYLGGSQEKVVVPDTIEGLPVYSMGPAAFKSADIQEISISKNVTYFHDELFADCINLKTVTFTDVKDIPEGVVPGNGICETGRNVFAGCVSLANIELPDSMIYIGDYFFYGCSSLKKIAIPSQITSIPTGMFEGCAELKEIHIGEQVTSIAQNAFAGVPETVCFYGTEYSAAAVFAAENFYRFVVTKAEITPEQEGSTT